MFVSAYMIAKDRKEARKIAEFLVKKKLAACANIFPIESFYIWEEKMQNHAEYAVIAKTRRSSVKKLISAVKRIHSYSVPCIVFWQIAEGSRDYLDWVRKETR